ncbi:MAG: AAA family ATPase [Woeseiaceae bacterium]|jgi:type II secretory pathway predicted ATPase ExeA|nr:AAA family ATPase [Woeseiaceae bacterium]
MFEQHFGLKSNPFDGQAAGADVFVGPQTATLVNRAKRIFAGPESVICISGPVGSGKSTLAARALAAVGRPHTIIRIGRIRLGPDEVLDFLLRELGLKQMPAGTIQKMTVFRSVLKKLEDQDVRLFIVVEDAERLGAIALQELEALTATDSGVSSGANLLLMAEDSLKQALEAPSLKRLRQRTRLHYGVQAMTAAEVRGYLTHRIRRAGGDMSQLVTDDAVVAVHSLAEGIPRVIDNLMNSALESAAEKRMPRLDAAELGRVAAEEYGLEPAAPLADTAPAGGDELQPPPPAPPNVDMPKQPAPAAAARPQPAQETADTTAVPDDDFEIPDLIQDTSPGMVSPKVAEAPIPDLIQDTSPGMQRPEPCGDVVNEPLPDLDALTPDRSAPDPDTLAEVALDDEFADIDALTWTGEETDDTESSADDDIPTLFASSAGMEAPTAESRADLQDDEVPAWDRDPTLAELRPDLDALERAMAIAHGDSDSDSDSGRDKQAADNAPAPKPVKGTLQEAPEQMPEITLDDSIRRKVEISESGLLDADPLDGSVPECAADASTTSETISIVEDLGSTPAKADKSLDRIAAELARAKSLEEVDDKLAETLFSEEFSLMAAEVAANAAEPAPEPEPAPEAKSEAEAKTETEAKTEKDASPPLELTLKETDGSNDAGHPADDTGDASAAAGAELEREFLELYGESAVEVSMETTPTGLSVAKTETRSRSAGRNGSGSQKPAPEPIEDQINTSITQTLKAFDPAKFADTHTEERTGFFSRFRRS